MTPSPDRPADPFGPRRRIRLFFCAIATAGLGAAGYLCVDLARLSAMEPQASADRPILTPARGGALVIGGGGRLPDEVKASFLELAGGPDKARILVIPTAHRIADDAEACKAILQDWRQRGVESVDIFHTRDRRQADDPEFVRPLAEATGVWFGGGWQKMLSEAYVGTEVERQLKALLERGGVIGGSSAGAAIMTRVMIASGRTEAVLGEGFDLLPNAVVDQHFLRRNRLKRLQGILAKHPGLLGLGIDERTALIVRGKQARVVGESYVVACAPTGADRPPRIEFLKHGDTADLEALLGEAAARTAVAPALDLDSVAR